MLKNKKLVYIIVIFVIFTIGSGTSVFFIYDSLKKAESSVYEEFSDKQSTQVNFIASSLEKDIGAIVEKLKFISSLDDIHYDSEECSETMSIIGKTASIPLANIARVGLDGKLFCSISESVNGLDGFQYDYIRTIFEDPNHKPILSRFLLSTTTPLADEDKKILFAIHTPVFNGDEFIGSVGGAFFLDDFVNRAIELVDLSDDAWVVIMDDNGDLLGHPKVEYVGLNIFEDPFNSLLSKNEDLDDLLKSALTIDKYTSIYNTALGTENFGNIKHAKVINDRIWAVLVTEPIDNILISLKDSNKDVKIAVYIIFISLLFLLILSTLVFFLWDRSLKKNVNEKTKEIDDKIRFLEESKKNLEKSLGDSRFAKDEADKLNIIMVDRELKMKKLKQRIKELESQKNGEENKK